ncbi:MAG: imidazole glycerol phosphate synthase cyclase subunit, partial [Firmicutes bacterium]|nr:imidazole glycerol phosphate synthase cyclase subunit [Bacillota bacterium]
MNGLACRLIPCLDVRHGRVVKGVHFDNLVDAGDPVALAWRYAAEGADELVWLDVVATVEERRAALAQIEHARQRLDIPLTVGGGITSIKDVRAILAAGADKVSINSRALAEPSLITEVAERWGRQCVVVAIDAKLEPDGSYGVYSHGGRVRTGRELLDWIRTADRLGAGEFLLTSIDTDGTGSGFDLPMLRLARMATDRPIIASGGAGSVEDLEAAAATGVDAMLLASLL